MDSKKDKKKKAKISEAAKKEIATTAGWATAVIAIILLVTLVVVMHGNNEDKPLSETEQMEQVAREAQEQFESQMAENREIVIDTEAGELVSIDESMKNLIAAIGLDNASSYQDLQDLVSQTQSIIDQQAAIDTQISEDEATASMTEDGQLSADNVFYQDNIYLMCKSDAGNYSVYGFTSTTYGACGFVICQDINDSESYQYYGDSWTLGDSQPSLVEKSSEDGTALLDFTFQPVSSISSDPITVSLTTNSIGSLVSDQSVVEGMLYYK